MRHRTPDISNRAFGFVTARVPEPPKGGGVNPYGFGFVTDQGEGIATMAGPGDVAPTVSESTLQNAAEAWRQLWHAIDKREKAQAFRATQHKNLVAQEQKLPGLEAAASQGSANLYQAQSSPWWSKCDTATTAYQAAVGKSEFVMGGKDAELAPLKAEADKWCKWRKEQQNAAQWSADAVKAAHSAIAIFKTKVAEADTAIAGAAKVVGGAKQYAISACEGFAPLYASEFVKFDLWVPGAAKQMGITPTTAAEKAQWKNIAYAAALGRLWYLADVGEDKSLAAANMRQHIKTFEDQLETLNETRKGIKARVIDKEKALAKAEAKRKAAADRGDENAYAAARSEVRAIAKSLGAAKADLRAQIEKIADRGRHLAEVRQTTVAYRTESTAARNAFKKRASDTGIDPGQSFWAKVNNAYTTNVDTGKVIIAAGKTLKRVTTEVGQTISDFDLGGKLEDAISKLVYANKLAEENIRQVKINTPDEESKIPAWAWVIALVAAAKVSGVA